MDRVEYVFYTPTEILKACGCTINVAVTRITGYEHDSHMRTHYHMNL